MRRTIVAIIAGFVGWAVIVTAIDWGLRFWLPGYRQAEPTLVFTLTMKIARLTMAAVTSLGAGAIVRAIAPPSRLAPWIVGLVIVALFLPTHVHLWHRFPIWYHLSFLLPLAPLLALGGWLVLLSAHRGGDFGEFPPARQPRKPLAGTPSKPST